MKSAERQGGVAGAGSEAGPVGLRWGRLRRLGWWWAVALTAAVGVAVAATGAIRFGGYLMAAALGAAAVVRAALPAEPAGGIVVRRRWLDVATLVVLALTLFVAFTLVRP